MKLPLCSLALALLFALPAPRLSAQAPPPNPPSPAAPATPATGATNAAKQTAPAPAVYDESADARADVDAALARAKKENRRVLIQWGANWCGWCRALHATMTANAKVAQKLMYEYDVVRVDVGHFDKNMDLAAKFGAKWDGIPFLTILDADGKPLVNQPTDPFELKDGKTAHDPELIAAFLTEHQAPYLKADDLRAAALSRAKSEKKRLFLHYGAPWCGWCHKLEDWMGQPEVAALLAKEFVELKIDTDRTIGGKEALAQERATAGSKEGGIPWFVFLDAEGKQLATSDNAKGNIGCPYEDPEIDHFVTMLEKARVNLTPADVETLRKSLVAMRDDDKKRRAAHSAN